MGWRESGRPGPTIAVVGPAECAPAMIVAWFVAELIPLTEPDAVEIPWQCGSLEVEVWPTSCMPGEPGQPRVVPRNRGGASSPSDMIHFMSFLIPCFATLASVIPE